MVVVQLTLGNSSGSASALSEGSTRCVRTLRLFLAYYRSLFPGFCGRALDPYPHCCSIREYRYLVADPEWCWMDDRAHSRPSSFYWWVRLHPTGRSHGSVYRGWGKAPPTKMMSLETRPMLHLPVSIVNPQCRIRDGLPQGRKRESKGPASQNRSPKCGKFRIKRQIPRNITTS